MSDIFISYARSTAREAQAIAEALRALGYDVWRDDELPAHRSFAEVIEERISAAKAVVVIWSAEAVRSEWVQSEADRARNDHKLVQLTIDSVTPPMPFDRIQCADMIGWSGDLQAPGWRKVVASIEELTGTVSAAVQGPGGIRSVALRQPSIAVLPFTNMSDDREHEFLADGMTEDIITGLSLTKSLFVIARNSTFIYKGRAVNVRNVGRELGVRHVLEGSVRRAGEAVRVTAQLIDASTDAHVWSQSFDRPLADIFKVQDEITGGIVAALTGELTRTATDEAARARPDSLEAWQLCQRVFMVLDADPGRAGRRAAEAMARSAVEEDPTYAAAWGQLGVLIGLRWTLEPHTDIAADREEARACLERGVRLAPRDPDLMAYQGSFMLSAGRPRDAIAYLEEARHLNPNDVTYRLGLARALRFTGQPVEALAEMEVVLKLSPLDPMAATFAYEMSEIHLALGHYAESERWARRSITGGGGKGSAHLALAMALAALGHLDEARSEVAEHLQHVPDCTRDSLENVARNLGCEESVIATRANLIALAWPSAAK